jgi:hypothetical protein
MLAAIGAFAPIVAIIMVPVLGYVQPAVNLYEFHLTSVRFCLLDGEQYVPPPSVTFIL